jgi:protein involved in polysaccharide export with SLBB domain
MPASLRIVPRGLAALLPFLMGMAAAFLSIPESAFPQGGLQPVTVSVEGAIRRPGGYTLPAGATLSSLLVKAGGFTDSAFPAGAVLRRMSVRTAQEAELQVTADRISREAEDVVEASDAARPVARLLRSLSPSGRVLVRLTHPRLLKGSPADIPLEEGDALFVPGKTDTVAVTGAVRDASARIPFSADLDYKGYIRRAGGYADESHRDDVYLQRADGTTALLSLGFISWNPGASRWEMTALAGSTPTVGPGDTIVVLRPPPKGLPPKISRELPAILMRAAEIAGKPVILP